MYSEPIRCLGPLAARHQKLVPGALKRPGDIRSFKAPILFERSIFKFGV